MEGLKLTNKSLLKEMQDSGDREFWEKVTYTQRKERNSRGKKKGLGKNRRDVKVNAVKKPLKKSKTQTLEEEILDGDEEFGVNLQKCFQSTSSSSSSSSSSSRSRKGRRRKRFVPYDP